MRKRPTPGAKKWEDLYVTLSHENTNVRFYNSGKIEIEGNVKNGAVAFAKYILDSTTGKGSMNYLCIKIHLKEKYFLEWVGKEEDLYFKPEFWGEFQQEFERYCELKAFL